MLDTRTGAPTCPLAEQSSGTRVCSGVYQPRNKSDDKAVNSAETGTLQRTECFRNGHFAPKTGENAGESAPLNGSLGEQLLDGGKGA
jgi:hypothetical protein